MNLRGHTKSYYLFITSLRAVKQCVVNNSKSFQGYPVWSEIGKPDLDQHFFVGDLFFSQNPLKWKGRSREYFLLFYTHNPTQQHSMKNTLAPHSLDGVTPKSPFKQAKLHLVVLSK